MTAEDVRDARSCERFLLDPPIQALFGGSAVEIVDIASLGLRTEHPSPVRPGTEGLVSFRIPGAGDVVRVRAEVVWSRLSQKASPEGKLLYRSGLRLQSQEASLSEAIEHLLRVDSARPDDESLSRKKAKTTGEKKKLGTETVKVIRQHRRIDEDTLLLIKQAWTYMKHNPVEANKWYNRAKYSLKEKDAPRLHHKDDVLAIWEYLERMIPIETIDWVLDNEHLI